MLGLGVAALFVGSSALCGIALRRAFVPTWQGALAGLASSILALSVFLPLCEALGSVGLFRRWTLAVASCLRSVERLCCSCGPAGDSDLVLRHPADESRPSKQASLLRHW